MRNHAEMRDAISTAASRLELYAVTEQICRKYGFRYNESASYADNARRADNHAMYGCADMLRYAAQRERLL